MTQLSAKTKILVGLVVLFGIGILVQVPLTWGHPAYARFTGTFFVALFAARLKVSLPRLSGSMSVNLPFILLALSELSLAEALLITAASTLVQCLWSDNSQQKPIKILFNVSVTLMAAQAAWFTMQATAPNSGLGLALGALAYLLVNTVPVAGIIALTESGNLFGIWRRILQLTFPYFVLAAGVAGLAKLATHAFAWYIPLLILPLMFLVQRSFTVYFQTIRDTTEQKSAYAMAATSRG
ncbi:MAG TPA: hypothetical protein VNZ03_34560 [Terriglobales bacterium]|jgi:hypothetical protein|nr:hypothetical protein [Terriglobales bacterium]